MNSYLITKIHEEKTIELKDGSRKRKMSVDVLQDGAQYPKKYVSVWEDFTDYANIREGSKVDGFLHEKPSGNTNQYGTEIMWRTLSKKEPRETSQATPQAQNLASNARLEAKIDKILAILEKEESSVDTTNIPF